MELETAVEYSSDMIVITDPQGCIQYVNPSFEKVTGYEQNEVIGKTMNFLRSGKQDHDFYDYLWKTINAGNIWKGALINKKKSGMFYYVDMKTVPIKDIKGSITHFIALQQDVTSFVEREKAFIMKNKEMSDLLKTSGSLVSLITKEMGDVLSVARTSKEVIPENQDKSSSTIEVFFRSSITKLEKLIDQVRHVSGLKKTKIGMKMTYSDVTIPVLSAIEAVQQEAAQKQLSITHNTQKSIHKLYCDIGYIHDVVKHLLLNAIAVSSKGEEISVQIQEEHGFVDISVIDRGTGLSPDQKSKIFEPSFSEEKRGLLFCKEAVEEHNGCIFIETVFGKGSSFIVRLPIEKRLQTR